MPTQTMTAIAIEGGKGEASALHAAQIATPSPAEGQILIRVRAAGVNRPDILQRKGAYPPPPGAPETLGLEVAGDVVVAAGRWKVGSSVSGAPGGGGYAEYAAVDARHALPIPDGLDYVQAAALPETVFTVYVNIFEHGGLKAGETLLVHGATSGIGVAAIQMAKAAGCKVIATARGSDKAATARAMGADLAIDALAEDFGAAARAFGGADVILDMVGGPYFEPNMDALNFRGRLVYIASQGGGVAEVPIFKLMMKQAVLTGSTLRARSADEKARITAAIEEKVWPWVASGQVKAVVDATFPLADAAKAHAHLEGGAHVGKVVLVA
jgi:NADPH2:quinone reductase